ncbi:MAG: 3-methyl-2-oxobutanoate dehydrogenase subunit VorB [bacterium]
MGKKQLLRGNEAVGEAAVRAGCRFYFGYPITPQNELPEYMARRMPEVGGTFIQSESELSAINMVLGASVTGARAMTSSSSPGISLKQEGISFMAAMELPGVVVNIIRGGPGLGNIAPAQSDYFQATRGGGHGDYRTIVLAPASVQELADLTHDAFDLADRYRTPVVILADGMIGQMMEPVEFRKPVVDALPEKSWALRGARNRRSRFIRSLILDVDLEEEHNWKLYRKYQRIQNNEVRWDEFMTDDAATAVVAYGTAARIAKGAIIRAREKGIPAGLFRPVTLWPFPMKQLKRLAERLKTILVFEMSTGQMLEDVKLAVEGAAPVEFHGRPGGVIPTPAEVLRVISRVHGRAAKAKQDKPG